MKRLGLVFALISILSITNSFSQNANLERAAEEAYAEAVFAYNSIMDEISEIKVAIARIQDGLNQPPNTNQASSPQITLALQAAGVELLRAENAYMDLMHEIRGFRAEARQNQTQSDSPQIASVLQAAEYELLRAENAYLDLMRELRELRAEITRQPRDSGQETSDLIASLMEEIKGLKAEIRESANMQRQPAAPTGEGLENSAPRYSSANEIIGVGRLQKEVIVAFIRSKNPMVSANVVDSLANVYIQEATLEDINLNIAIAQMVFATNFLRNEQRMNIHNYAGISGLSFLDSQTGIRAHIQHLKGYASTEAPKNAIVNPRYNILRQNGILGTIKTRQQLYSTWAPLSRDYRERIESILYELEQFSVRLARN